MGKEKSRPVRRVLLWVWRIVTRSPILERILLRIINPRFIAGVLGIVRDSEGRVLLLKHTYRRELPWGIPGGWLRKGESMGACLGRELEEETGFSVRVDSLYHLLSGFSQPKIEAVFLCTITGGEFQPDEEISEHKFVGPSDDLSINPRHRDVVLRYFAGMGPGGETRMEG